MSLKRCLGHFLSLSLSVITTIHNKDLRTKSVSTCTQFLISSYSQASRWHASTKRKKWACHINQIFFNKQQKHNECGWSKTSENQADCCGRWRREKRKMPFLSSSASSSSEVDGLARTRRLRTVSGLIWINFNGFSLNSMRHSIVVGVSTSSFSFFASDFSWLINQCFLRRLIVGWKRTCRTWLDCLVHFSFS